MMFMNEELFSFLNEVSADEELQQTLRGMSSAQELVDVGTSRGYNFSEQILISNFAETLTRSSDDLASFLKKLAENEELQQRIRTVNTAEGVVAIASQLGYHFNASELIRHSAETILHADDSEVVIIFDALGCHFGSFLSALKLSSIVHSP